MKKWTKILFLFLLSFLLIFTSCEKQSGKDNLNVIKEKISSIKEVVNKKDKFQNKDSKQTNIKEDDIIYINLVKVKKGKAYYSLEDVASYIKQNKKLPENFLKKREAIKLGWDAKEGNLWAVTEKKVIGGDLFRNREGQLPKKITRKYYEADIDYNGGRRNAKRLIYSNDGLIYYTKDHYKSFKEVKVK